MYPNQKGNVLVSLLFVAVLLAGGYLVYKFNAPPAAKTTENPAVENKGAGQNLPSETAASGNGNNGSDIVLPPAATGEFAKYEPENTKYQAKLPEYKIGLSEIANLAAFEKKSAFSQAQKNQLLQNNFFIAANADKFYQDFENGSAGPFRVDDWTDLYDNIGGPYSSGERAPENSVFITSDFLLHVYHRLIENEFEYAEQASFYPGLKDISRSLLSLSSKNYTQAIDNGQKESYDRLAAYFLVSTSLLESASPDHGKLKSERFIPDSQSDSLDNALKQANSLAAVSGTSVSAKEIARQELRLIYDAKGLQSSPLFGKYQSEAGLELPEDYSQYTPRSHYAKNAVLRSYFRAMMWYGRTNFLLASSELTRDAANLSQMITDADIKKWESIYGPTAFFVGQTDDLGFFDYRQAIKKTGFDIAKLDSIKNLQEELKTYKNPQIMSSAAIGDKVTQITKEDLQNKTKGFRFMGQRFTPDAFIFSTLTQGGELPDAKTGQSLPSTPTALMVASLMGSQASQGLLDDWIKANAPKSDKIIADRMSLLNGYFAKLGEKQWTQNIYWSWLYTLKPLFIEKLDKTGYPMFVKNDAWSKKNLQSFLGSWTELKHDTLLYAKQSYAEMGAGGGDEKPKPVPRGYVEPNIEFLDRLISLVKLSRDGLKQFDLLGNFEYRNNNFIENLEFYRKIALAELQDEKISDDDFEKLRLSAGNLSAVVRSDAPELLEKDTRSALIADVHTDVAKGQILYEANGIPNYIYVAVKDANGTRLTQGLVYSYYEFTYPLGTRLTDSDWQKWNYSEKSKIPAMAEWNKSLIK